MPCHGRREPSRLGGSLVATGGYRVIVAVAVLVGASALVAVTVTVSFEVIEAGAE